MNARSHSVYKEILSVKCRDILGHGIPIIVTLYLPYPLEQSIKQDAAVNSSRCRDTARYDGTFSAVGRSRKIFLFSNANSAMPFGSACQYRPSYFEASFLRNPSYKLPGNSPGPQPLPPKSM